MPERYCIDLSRKERAWVSYCPALELKNKPGAEWLETILLPLLLPVARRKNKKLTDVPITFWAFTRQTARSFREELFLFITPGDLNAVAVQIMKEALQPITDIKLYAGLEPIPDDAFPICQIFRGKVIRFFYSVEGAQGYYLPAVKWQGGAPTLALAHLEKSGIFLDNREPEMLLMRARVNTVMNGKYYRAFQQALNCIGTAEL